MKDPRYQLIKKVRELLLPIGLPVFSMIPANNHNPFIFVGGVTTTQLQNKSRFRIGGILTVELYTGTNAWTGSIVEPLEWLDEMKIRLQLLTTSRPAITGNLRVVNWRLESDTGIQPISITEQLYTALIQYRFEVEQLEGYYERVTADNGIVEAIDCLPIQIL